MPMAWFMYPISFESSRDFDCADMSLTPEQCDYYMQKWHFWYVSDFTYALSSMAFFVATIGVFFLANVFNASLGLSRAKRNAGLERLKAGLRYLSYRGYRVKALKWNSAPIGVLLLGAAGFLFFFLITVVPQPYYWPEMIYGYSPPLGTRGGWLALACMPFLFATASKTSWITLFTGVSHEKLQVFHRWIAYAFLVLALVHTFPFIIYHTYYFNDLWIEVTENSTFVYWTGIVALIVQAWLTFASFSTIRNLGYEFFKIAHFAGVMIFIITFFWHCGGTLTSWDYFVATAAVYVPSLVYPWLRTIFEYGIGQKAYLHLEDNDFIRVTIPTSATWVPGQHCFLRFTGLGWHALTTHPFTICSLPPLNAKDPSELVFYIRKKKGLTARLHALASASSGQAVSVLVDGPYGGVSTPRLFESERVFIIAGGSGAGWTLPFVELFARRNASPKIQDQKEDADTSPSDGKEHISDIKPPGLLSLRLVAATRDIATREWFLTALDRVLSQYPEQREAIDSAIEIHLTGHATGILQDSSDTSGALSIDGGKPEVTSSVAVEGSKTRQYPGRPDLPRIVADEAQLAVESKETLGVYVCGPNEMQNDVRNAVAKQNLAIFNGSGMRGVYLHTEHFSWA